MKTDKAIVISVWNEALNEKAKDIGFKDWLDYLSFCNFTKASQTRIKVAYDEAIIIFHGKLSEMR